MGLWNLGVKPAPPERRLRWREPCLFGMRLRNRQVRAALMFFGIWAVTTAVAFAVLVGEENAPFLLGSIFSGLVVGSVFWIGYVSRDDYRGGFVVLQDRGICREIRSASGYRQEVWRYFMISHCGIVSHVKSGLPYSMLALCVDDAIDVIGVPKKVDLEELACELERHGVTVTPLKGIRGCEPRERLPLYLIPAGPAAAILLLAGVCTVHDCFFMKDQPAAVAPGDRGLRVLRPAERPDPRLFDVSRPVMPPHDFEHPGAEEIAFPSADPARRDAIEKALRQRMAEYRVWTDVSGASQIEAKLTEVRDDEVSLEKRDGEIVKLPLSQLSEHDRDLVAGFQGALDILHRL